jgi:hypothetical protein
LGLQAVLFLSIVNYFQITIILSQLAREDAAGGKQSKAE